MPHSAHSAGSCAGSDLIGFMCGNVFQSHTCEIPPHLLAISSGHNTQQREESPQRLDSLDCSSAFIAAERGRKKKEEKSRCSLSPQQVLHYPSSSFVFFCVCFFCRSPDSADCSLSCCATPDSSVLMRKVNVSVAVPQLRPCLFCKCLSVSPFTSPTIEALFFS